MLPISWIYSQGEWIRMDSPTDKRIWRIQCLDSLNCWAAGDSGLIVNTSNGGVDWQLQNSTIYNNILDIFFLNENLGWAVAIKFDEPSGAYVLNTSDGGTTWHAKLFDTSDTYFFTVYFLDSLDGFLAGAPSYVFYRTNDGGITWNTVQFDSSTFGSLPIVDLEFYSNQYGFACGGQRDVVGIIWKTTDSGFSWVSTELGPDPLVELHFVDSLNIFGVGGDYEFGASIVRSTDGGSSWNFIDPGTFGVATGLSFRTKNEAWACITGEGKFLVSTDSGLNWEIRLVPEQDGINDITFTDSLHGFAVGDGGVILKYKPQIPSLISDEKNLLFTSILYQNYPNPFNPITKINWQSSVSSQQVIKVFDIVGNEVMTLLDEYRPAGFYELEFSTYDHLTSGIYFYQLKIGESIQTKKMILLR